MNDRTTDPAPPSAGALSSGPSRVVSGGQTGVDRAALDAARAAGRPTGGWCPAGRWAEDGPIPARYPLVETASADPAERTVLNVRDSNATLVVAPAPLAGGTLRTVEAARDMGRPCLIVDPHVPDAVETVRRWWAGAASGAGGCLNVAGPRESEAPGIYAVARTLLDGWLGDLNLRRPVSEQNEPEAG